MDESVNWLVNLWYDTDSYASLYSDVLEKEFNLGGGVSGYTELLQIQTTDKGVRKPRPLPMRPMWRNRGPMMNKPLLT